MSAAPKGNVYAAKPDNKRASDHLHIRLTSEEKARIVRNAKKHGHDNVTDYIKRACAR